MITDSNYFPEVLQVVPGKDYELFVYFDDGSIHRVDARPLLEGDVFAPIRDPETFQRALTVMNGTVAWDPSGQRDASQCVDLDPIALYRDTPEVDEPAWLREDGESSPQPVG
ncbi:MAG: DUF2442 domain-containing protein [Deltaproteobacteria bacterium]|nr:DUF2442 domain-containing protein [Deltaproteobacteria bacterium]